MKKKLGLILLGLFVTLVLFGYLFIYRPYINIRKKVNVLLASGKEIKNVFAKNDIDLLNTKLDQFTNQYNDFQKEAKSIYWASFIPYVADLKNGIGAGEYLLKAAKESIIAITPYADLIGFKKGASSFVERSAEDRLQTAVLTLDKVLIKIDVISEDIKQAQIKINTINPNRYPKKIGKTIVRDKIINIKEQFSGLTSLFVDAKPFIKSIPQILGSDKEKTYLLLFQNDKEIRATGGFITFYAILKIKNGKITIAQSEDIYSLDNSIAVHPKAPKEIITYHKNVDKFYIRDSNLSPDFVKSIGLFNSLYEKSGSKVEYDGVIALDSKILVDMLTIFGDINVDGITFSAKLDKRCNCPGVIYKLFEIVDEEVGYVKENRKGILGNLMYKMFYNAIGFSPSKYWGTLIQTMLKNLEEKHMLLYFTDNKIQQSIVKLNFAGRIRDYNNDYLHINNVNFAGAKANLFVNESITSTTTNQSGKIERKVVVEFKNPFPHSNCGRNQERVLCLNATLRNWIRVYVPQGSQLITFEGSSKKVNTYDELGKTVFEGFLEVPTEGIAKVIVNYKLPDKFSLNNYQLLIQKQPGTQNQKLKVEVDKKVIFQGILDRDKEIKAQ